MKLRLNSNCCARKTSGCINPQRIRSVQYTEIGFVVSNITEYFSECKIVKQLFKRIFFTHIQG